MDRPNVVWLTLDSVRADHTTMHGYERDTTPAIAGLAAEPGGRAYTGCFAHAHSTRMNTASILTGTYPTHHGVGVYDIETVLPDELETLGELFSAVGYDTAFFSSNANGAMGYEAGFDTFNWISGDTFLSTVDLRTAVKYALNLRRHSAGFTTDTAKHATPYVLNDMTKRWVRERSNGTDPFFVYVHYNEPHRPYYPPLAYRGAYAAAFEMSPEEAAEFALDVHRNIYEYVTEGLPFSEDEWAALLAMYDAEIRYTDAMVGSLVEFVRERAERPTVFVVTADHGELFGEHGLLSHETVLDDALTHIPLVVLSDGDTGFDHGPADGFVQHADVVQELVATAGGETSQMQGEPLDGSREYVISQRREYDFSQYTDLDPAFDTDRFHRPVLTALRTEEFKYQQSEAGHDLFELPDEERDVSGEYPEVTAELQATLEEWLAGPGQPVGESRHGEMDDPMRQQLRDLGYFA